MKPRVQSHRQDGNPPAGHPSTPRSAATLSMLAALVLVTAACTPTVKVEAPDKPIEINMNVNIKHEILVKVEKEVEAMFEDEDIF